MSYSLIVSGLKASNSRAYVRTAMRLHEARQPFVPISPAIDLRPLPQLIVKEVIEPHSGTGWISEGFTPTAGKSLAQVSFTSGSTGTPKGVMLSFDSLAHPVQQIVQFMQLDSDVREYVGVPAYYSFGFGRYRACAAVGGSAFMPEKGFNPDEIAVMLADGQINALSAVPTMLRLLLRRSHLFGRIGERMRWIEIGSQPMPRHEKEAIRSLFPRARIVQHYGLTEASRTTLLDISHSSVEALDSVGQAVAGAEIAVAADGRVKIRGPQVAREMLTPKGIVQLLDEKGWITTNDLGSIRDGLLFFHGRSDEIINCGGIKLSPDAIEERIQFLLGDIGICAVTKTMHPVLGEAVAVAVENAEISIRLKSIVPDVMQDFGIKSSDGYRIAVVDQIPRTETGKLRRLTLSNEFNKTLINPEILPESIKDKSEILQSFITIFPGKNITREDSFVHLGGDSLSHVQMIIALESVFGDLPSGWETKSITQLEDCQLSKAHERKWISRLDTEIALRAIASLGVVSSHVDISRAPPIPGGAIVLFMLAGYSLHRFNRIHLVDGSVFEVLGRFFRDILVPYYAIYAIMLSSSGKTHLSWSGVLLALNFQALDFGPMIPFWFIHALWQCIILFSLPFFFPFYREFVTNRPWQFSIFLLALALSFKITGHMIWDHSYTEYRTPDAIIYIMILGWTALQAQSIPQKIFVCGTTSLISLFDFSFTSPHYIWLNGGMIAISFLPNLKVPCLFYRMLIMLAAASFWTYLMHMLVIQLIRYELGIRNVPFTIIAAGIVGILCHNAWIMLRAAWYQQWHARSQGTGAAPT